MSDSTTRPTTAHEQTAPVTPPANDIAASRWQWLKPWAGAIAIVIVLLAALVFLRRELGGTGYHRLMEALMALPSSQIVAALATTVVAYLTLSGYDLLALRYIKARISPARVLLSSSLSYGISQTLGFPLLTGNAVRIRFWSSWGLSTEEMARAAASVSATFTVGIITVCGAALLIEPAGTLQLLHLPDVLSRTAGALLLGLTTTYLVWAARRSGAPSELRAGSFRCRRYDSRRHRSHWHSSIGLRRVWCCTCCCHALSSYRLYLFLAYLYWRRRWVC